MADSSLTLKISKKLITGHFETEVFLLIRKSIEPNAIKLFCPIGIIVMGSWWWWWLNGQRPCLISDTRSSNHAEVKIVA